ncbi:alpha/beta hydrolase, putative [Plasmodium relictum]|uniref:Alpha/beta hydrolase, putative n=1 Tax=Plasmodium relictum TaxID=85471 RepID=A0A1J1HCD5_PLARL|nr:alpha/beta hydrolase, putative [Plasmodium relictum]CRH03145.1 alpha/beta hydrolase, putative [Plasmodium relictum]
MGNSLSNTALFRPTEPSYDEDLKDLVFIPELLGIDVNKFWNDETFEIFNKEENIKSLKNKKFPALFLYFSKELKTKHTIIYFHSNSCDLGQIYEELLHLQGHLHANILAIEYVGFGLCYLEGSSNQYNINRRALAAYNFLINLNMKSENILLFGRSIGTGVATKLVYNLKLLGKNVGGIILHAPFISIEKLVEDYFSYSSYFIENIYDNFKNLQIISNNNDSDIPLLLIHGKEDEIIGVSHSEFLMKNLNNKYKNASYPNDSYHNYYYVIDDLGIPIKTFLETSSKSQYQKSIDIVIPKVFLQKETTKEIINHLNENTTEEKLEKKIKISDDILLSQHIKGGEKKTVSIIKDDKNNSGSSVKRSHMGESSKKNKTKNNKEKSINKSEKKNIGISLSGPYKEKNRTRNQQKDSNQKILKSEIPKLKKDNELNYKSMLFSANDKNLTTNIKKERKLDILSSTLPKNTVQEKDKAKDSDSTFKEKIKNEKRKVDIIEYTISSRIQIRNKNDHIENECKIEKYEEKRENRFTKKDKELNSEEENTNEMYINKQYFDEMYVNEEYLEKDVTKKNDIKKMYEKEGNIEEIFETEENNMEEFEKKNRDMEYKNVKKYEKEENEEYDSQKEGSKEYGYEKEEGEKYEYEKEGNEEYEYKKEGNKEQNYKKEENKEDYGINTNIENEKIYEMEKDSDIKYKKDKNKIEEKREDSEAQEDGENENFNINNYKVKDFKYYLKNNIINKEKIGCFMNKVINNLNGKN